MRHPSDLTTNREPMPTAGANPLPCRSPEKHDRFCLPVSRAGRSVVHGHGSGDGPSSFRRLKE
jgi:hypothetical protein